MLTWLFYSDESSGWLRFVFFTLLLFGSSPGYPAFDFDFVTLSFGMDGMLLLSFLALEPPLRRMGFRSSVSLASISADFNRSVLGVGFLHILTGSSSSLPSSTALMIAIGRGGVKIRDMASPSMPTRNTNPAMNRVFFSKLLLA
mmetsp:Transcript_37764/g.93867  ORF Transcript_37764/g.93867 Transcript_37764/m.93867 type:complete len:144 (+) Transcript_37764:238-669(+)